MKKISTLLTAMLLIALLVSTSVSAAVIPTGPDGIVWYDPVTYEAPLSSFPGTTINILGSTYAHYTNFPENLTYVNKSTPVGTGYISHAYDANDAKKDQLLQFNVGEGSMLTGFKDITDKSGNIIGNSTMPGSIGKQKAEIVFRLTDFGAVEPNKSLTEVFDFRVWKSLTDGTHSGVMGLYVSQSGSNDLAWKTTLTSSGDSTRGAVNTDAALHLNTWYRATIATDFATSYQQGYIEKWNETTQKWEPLNTLFSLSGADGRSLHEMGIFCVSSSARIRISNKLGYDIAQARIIRDNIMAYRTDPNLATTAADKRKLIYGIISNKTQVKTDANIVAKTFVAGNALGKNNAGQPTSQYTYGNGTYAPRALDPTMIVAQYGEDGSLIQVNSSTVKLDTLNAGYRANGTNFCDYNYAGEPTTDEDQTSYLQKTLEYKELAVRAPKNANATTAKVFLLTGFDGMIPMTETIDYLELK